MHRYSLCYKVIDERALILFRPEIPCLHLRPTLDAQITPIHGNVRWRGHFSVEDQHDEIATRERAGKDFSFPG